ncbi:MAG: hypothetical protein CVU53_04340 [Deltaproteobacteria bacterium HGW-Deltaproteobacteria-11]|nr:MAG: hypothetical protein CVU53_04340 [Deltaproteobacteria bacterium HGW-Deltaproteobacteria-11]
MLPAEASTLRDLYAKLSPDMHDDLRNFYVNTDKAMFQTRYDQIVAVETAITSSDPLASYRCQNPYNSTLHRPIPRCASEIRL